MEPEPTTSNPPVLNGPTTTLATKERTAARQLTTFGSVPPFDIGRPSEWRQYLQVLELYFSSNDLGSLPPERQRDIFLSLAGPDVFQHVRAIVSPEDYKTKSLDFIVALLSKSFTPKESLIMNSCNFFNRVQATNESIQSFAADLRKLAKSCKFDNMLDRLLRDKFVVGLHDVDIRQRIFLQKDDLSFEEAIEIATSYELAVKRSKAVRFSQPETSSFEY